MIAFKLLTVVATCLAGVILAQDYQEYRQAPLRIGTKAEEPKPTPVPILKQINSDRSGYYRKRCFTAVRNDCKLRSGAKTHSRFNARETEQAVQGAAVLQRANNAAVLEKQQQQQQQRPAAIAVAGKKKLFKPTANNNAY